MSLLLHPSTKSFPPDDAEAKTTSPGAPGEVPARVNEGVARRTRARRMATRLDSKIPPV